MQTKCIRAAENIFLPDTFQGIFPLRGRNFPSVWTKFSICIEEIKKKLKTLKKNLVFKKTETETSVQPSKSPGHNVPEKQSFCNYEVYTRTK